MKSSKLALAMLLAIALAPCAKASVISLGTISGTSYLLGYDGAGPFSDIFAFTLSGPSNIAAAFSPLVGISGFGYSLLDTTTSTNFGSSSNYSGLSAGNYDFIFSGNVSTPIPFGVYFGDYTVSAAAVPELDTWLMLLIGGGLLAYQLRRRQNSIRQFVAT